MALVVLRFVFVMVAVGLGFQLINSGALASPDLVKRFVQATVKSYKEAEANPEAAVAAMADIVGGTMNEPEGKAQALAVLKVTLGVLYSPGNKDKKLGEHVAKDWDDMLALMKTYNGLQTTKPASAFYTNSFLP